MQEQATNTAAEEIALSRTPLAFMSYVNLNDQHDYGDLTQFRERLSGEVRFLTGEAFDIFQDRKDIAWGQQWQERINESLDAVTFLIPIITPSFFKSDACRAELEHFLKREEELGRGDLILPVYYATCPVLSDKEKLKHDPLAQIIAARQYADWRHLRHEPFTSPQLRKAITKIAERIVAALERSYSVTNIQQHEPKPAPTAKNEPPTVVVDAWHRGDYVTITEALEAVKAGTRILVKPGWYKECIVIDKTVEIIGDGERDDIVIDASGKPAVLFKTGNGRVANLTLRHAGGGEWVCVDIASGRLDLEDCDISSQDWACVAIHDGAAPRLRRNSIHGGKAFGVFVYKNGQGTLEDNEIFANAEDGVVISDGGYLTLRRNRISQNSDWGIMVYDGGGGIFEDNDLRGNARGAWDIERGCESRMQQKGNLE